MKKLKLMGEAYNILKNTAFVKGKIKLNIKNLLKL
jgi:hypothetical protein